ncbi:MAG: ammonium transporter [Pseudomonadota bacterium]|nr:ammonium transporter [Pseudomonadota bacterium]
MSQMGYIVIGLIIIFVFGQWMMLRPSPRERLRGQLRDRAKKMGLNPRLVAAPEWIGIRNDTQRKGGMVAFYHVVLPEAELPLTQAKVVDGRLRVIHGARAYHDVPFAVIGAIAIEMQANCVGLYWDEEADFRGERLEALKAAMLELANARPQTA